MSDFDDFMTDFVTIEPFTARDGYGDATYGAAVSYACRVMTDQQQVTTVQGEQVVSRGKIYIMGNPVIDGNDRITLPAGNVPLQPPIIRVDVMTDELGPHHVEITV